MGYIRDMARFSVMEGHEIRGFRIRLYPTPDQERALLSLEADLRTAWNWLVKQTEDTLDAREAYAIRIGAAPPRLSRPDYDGMTPEEAKVARDDFRVRCAARQSAIHAATKGVPSCEYRRFKDTLAHFGCKYDYQLLGRVIAWSKAGDVTMVPGAHALQSLAKNYFGSRHTRRKKFRRAHDSMPLQTRSCDCFEVGAFGERRGRPFYDCRVKFNGISIRGRLPGMSPAGRVLEGVSIVREADGWWASIKQEVPVRVHSPAEPGTVVGIDVGLDNLAALSDGRRIVNSRGKALAERIAGRQALGRPVGRLHLRAARQVKHVIYNEIVKPLATVETIKVEALNSKIGQMGSSKTSAMRLLVSILKDRYGDRVREVDPRYTSQDCSQCGQRSKESWSYAHGRFGKCPFCGYSADRDVNAARNVAARPAISEGA
jgi:hypothetical protein